MVSEITSMIPAPELSFFLSMSETSSRWERHGDYSIWCGGSAPGSAVYVLNEWRDDRFLAVPRRGAHPVMHRIAAGTPFEVERLFGFWMSLDVDSVWIDTSVSGGQRCALVVGGSKGKPSDAACLWVCPKCGAPFARDSFAIARQRLERFLEFAQERVRAFNADAQVRTCPSCAAVHPPSYGFYMDADGEAERAARRGL
jgi:rubredoxin